MRSDSVSVISGRRQAPALRFITIAAWVLASIGAVSTGRWAQAAGVAAIGLVTAAPLLRVGWLIYRWVQERDLRFVWTAVGLLVIIAVGAVAALVTG